MADESKKRSNFWMVIAYPESSNEDWKKRLGSLHIKAIVSPLHSPDPDPEYEEEKKQHWHVMFMYDSLKSRNQAKDDFDYVFGKGYTSHRIDIPRSKSGMLKYYCHLQNPEKEKLDPADVLTFGGVDYLEEISDARNDFYTLLDMTEFIHTNHVKSFMKFVMYCQYNNLEWARISMMKSSLYIKAIIESERNWEKDNAETITATTTSREINNQ